MKTRALLVVLAMALTAAGPIAEPEASGFHRLLVRLQPGMSMAATAERIDDRWALVEVSAAGDDPAVVAGRLAAAWRTIVVPDTELDLAVDPRFPEQWPLENTGQTGGAPGADIHVTTAWELTTGSQEVVVAVIDSGVDLDHPDLTDRLWRNDAETAGNGLDDDENGFVDDALGWDFAGNDPVPQDEIGHGTGVAGVIGAAANGVGTVGVAPNTELMVVRVCGPSCLLSSVLAGIDYAVENGADILNLSLGGTGSGLLPLEESVAAAGEAGVLVVGAAGNTGIDVDANPNPYYPASFTGDHIISVAASDAFDRLPAWSNRGRVGVDLAAPGVEVLAPTIGGWELQTGTSFAAPHVAGAAALIWSFTPDLEATEVRQVLMETTRPLEAMAGMNVTGGRLDAGSAVLESGRPHARIATLPASATVPYTLVLDGSGSIDPAGDIVSHRWTLWDGSTTDGEVVSRLITDPGVYRATLVVTDATGLTSEASTEVMLGQAFADTAGSVFVDDIFWLSAQRITRGCGPALFCPLRAITRGEAAAMLTRLLDLRGATPPFQDSVDHVFAAEIGAIAGAGITRGCAIDRYCPDQPVTRAQLASMLVRATGLEVHTDHDTFIDDDGTVHEAEIEALVAAGVLRGCNPPENSRVCPQRSASRGEFAAILRRSEPFLPLS